MSEASNTSTSGSTSSSAGTIAGTSEKDVSQSIERLKRELASEELRLKSVQSRAPEVQAIKNSLPKTSINAILCSHAKRMRCILEWKGEPIEFSKVFDNEHLMPVVTQIASIKAVQLMDWNLDVSNEESKSALLGMKSLIPEYLGEAVSDTVRGLFYLHAAEKVFGLSRGGRIDCFPVYEYFKLDLNQRAQQAHRYTAPWAKQRPIS